MKKNLFIAALAFVAMGANAQVVNTLDEYQAGDQFEQDGIKYELLEVGNGNPVKVVEAAARSYRSERVQSEGHLHGNRFLR